MKHVESRRNQVVCQVVCVCQVYPVVGSLYRCPQKHRQTKSVRHRAGRPGRKTTRTMRERLVCFSLRFPASCPPSLCSSLHLSLHFFVFLPFLSLHLSLSFPLPEKSFQKKVDRAVIRQCTVPFLQTYIHFTSPNKCFLHQS